MKKRTRQRQSLDARLSAAATPVFALDAARELVFFNAGMEQLTGWNADDVLGAVCDYATGTGGEESALTGALCPPPEVLVGRPVSVPAYLRHKDGRSLPRLVNFYPLADGDGGVAHVLAVVTEIVQPARPHEPTAAQQLHAELSALKHQLRQRYSIESFIGKSPAMGRVLEQVQLACASELPLLIRGETGTGKEHVARLIHYAGRSAGRPFVPIDCRGLPARELKQILKRVLEDDEGKPTGTSSLRPGTLYLASVERLPRELQERLVEAYRDGDRRPTGLLRLMAGTNEDPQTAVEQERLLEELCLLLTPLVVEVPPLRQRAQDLKLLAQHLLESGNRGDEKQVGGFTDEVWTLFSEYNWPGNVDELAAVVAEARSACDQSLIQLDHLPFRFRTGLDAQAVGPSLEPLPMPLEPLLVQVETDQITRALEVCRQNKTKAAKLLGMTRNRLYRRMEALEIEDREGN